MYELYEPQPEDSFRDMHELGLAAWPPTDPVELAKLDAAMDRAEMDLAHERGWDPFSGVTASEYLATMESVELVEV